VVCADSRRSEELRHRKDIRQRALAPPTLDQFGAAVEKTWALPIERGTLCGSLGIETRDSPKGSVCSSSPRGITPLPSSGVIKYAANTIAIVDRTQHWRRNFIRSAAALIEGHAHCLREMCAVSFECIAPELTKKEADVLRSEESFSAAERMKLTLRAAYTLFELAPAPNFGGNEWPKAQKVLLKRHLLMHPKTPADLDVSDSLWNDIRTDIAWLMEQFFNFLSLLQEKHDITPQVGPRHAGA
jgi:hypothetical protein